MNEEKIDELIGKKIKGFKFKGNKQNPWSKRLLKNIGKIGTIDGYINESFFVCFDDNILECYPSSEIEKHIIETKFVLFQTDVHKSKSSRVFFGVFSSEELAQKAAENNNLLTDFSEIVILECYENYLEEQ